MVKVSSLCNKYYPVLKTVFVSLGPAVWPSVWFVRWTNSSSTRAYYTQQTWQCKGGSQGKTGLFVLFFLLFSSSVFFLPAFRLSPSSLLFFFYGMALKTSFTMRRISRSQVFQVSSDFVFWLEGFAIVLILAQVNFCAFHSRIVPISIFLFLALVCNM